MTPANPTGPDAGAITAYFTALDRVLPHQASARQHWVWILDPSATTFADVVRPLLVEARDRLAAQRARHRLGGGHEPAR